MIKYRAKILSLLGYGLLALAVFITILGYLCPKVAFFEILKSNAVPVGVLVALAGLLLTQARNMEESLEKRSQFYLDSCLRAYEEAKTLLLDNNNDRATWIAAGRTLKHTKELAQKITVDAHLRVLEIYELKYRRFFHELLKDKKAAFFYGAKDATLTRLSHFATILRFFEPCFFCN